MCVCVLWFFLMGIEKRKRKKTNQESVSKAEYIFSKTSLIFIKCMVELAEMF